MKVSYLRQGHACLQASASAFTEEDAGSQDIEDLVYSFITIMLEHSMRLKDGWKVKTS